MTKDTVTWRQLISRELGRNGEQWTDVVSSTLTEAELDVPFADGYGGEEGVPFTLWTKKFVYFPACYDGSEWCTSVSRKPNKKPTRHVGGG